jgi:pimeloyl-[acyl-carrier protein] methyl ester esterase
MDLSVKTFGTNGPYLLLIPGFSLTQGIWEKQTAEFSKHFRVVTLDLPGHGDSPALRHPLRLHQLGTLCHETLAKFLISEYCVLGWSMGGMIAQHMSLDFPQAVKKIILVGSTPQFVATANFPHAVRPGGHAKLKQQLQKDLTQGLAEFLKFATRDHVLHDHPEFVEFIRTHSHVEKNSILFYMDALWEFSTLTQLQNILCPSLVIAGKNDPLCPLAASQHLAQHMPHAQLEVFEHCGHFPFLTHTQAFNSRVIEFLQRV